jgi:predicted esterase
MKFITAFCSFLLVLLIINTGCQEDDLKYNPATVDYVEALKDTLASLSESSNDDYFRMHCNSIQSVINAKSGLNRADSLFLKDMFLGIINAGDPSGALNMTTYLQRELPLIISWVSPTDGAVSFSWLTLPKDWNPGNKYPLYIQLHGLWSVAGNSIEYLTYPYLQDPSGSTAFEDGYLLSPWGRGNYWYLGISETDIRECIAVLESIAVIDPARKYMSGHSMGGYGAWNIVSKSPDTWAALGIMAGALWYIPDVLNVEAARSLKDIPTYFVCGTGDDLLYINQVAFRMLQTEGNQHLQFVTFNGGHEYLEENVKNMYLWMRQYTTANHVAESKMMVIR